MSAALVIGFAVGLLQGCDGAGEDPFSKWARDAQAVIAHVDPTSAPYPESARERAVAVARVRRLADPKLAGLAAEARTVLDEIGSLGVDGVDLFHGSHVVIHDGGSRWSQWQAISRERRASSHYPGSPHAQFELDLPGLGVLLFGRTPDGDTWLQMEARGERDIGGHFADFVRHNLYGFVNVGPLGLSPRTDKRNDPIVVEP